MSPRRTIVCTLSLLALLASNAWALDENYFVVDDLTFGTTTLDFDTQADRQTPLAAPKLFEDATPLTNQYAALGIRFGGAHGAAGGSILHQDSQFGVPPHSGSNFLAFNREAPNAAGDMAAEPEVISFDTPVANVSLYVAGGFLPESFRLDGYGAAGNLVDSASITTREFDKLSIASAGGIYRAVLSRDGPRAHATVSVPNVTGAPGGTVTIPIQVDDRARGVASAHVKLLFEDVVSIPDMMQVAAGPLLAGGLVESDLSTPGTAAISAAAGKGTDGPGAILTLTGKIRADAPVGVTPLRLADVQLTDLLGETILVDSVDGMLTVQAAPAVVCGDLTGDGQLTLPDVIVALQIAVGLMPATDAQTAAACGHTLRIAFVVQLLQAVVGISGPPQPVGGG